MRYVTAGESHGPEEIAVIEGILPDYISQKMLMSN